MPSVKDFNPDRDIPSLQGKVVFVTGGTAGLGSASVKALAKHNPAHIYFTGRKEEAANALIEETRKVNPSASLTFIQCDLTSFQSIKDGMKRFTHPRCDILMCNAGVMAQPMGVSKDGYEIHFAINHLGNALIIKHLLPIMLQTAEQPGSDVRIVSLTSVGWRTHPSEGVQFSTIKSPQDLGRLWHWRRYGQSKFANIVYAAELARRHPSITSTSVHPGVVNTGLVENLGMMHKALVYAANLGNVVKVEEGCLNQLWAAAGGRKEEVVNGAFYMPVGVESQNKLDAKAKDVKFASELWEFTEKTLESF